MGKMRKWNRVVAAVTAVVGIAIIAMSLKFKFFLSSGDPGPGFWPAILGSLMVLCSIILVVNSLTSKSEQLEEKVVFWSPAHARVYKMMAVILMFCVVMYILGFYVAMILFIPVAMKLMGTENDKEVVIVTLSSVLIIFVAFQIGLKTTLPAPIFWR